MIYPATPGPTVRAWIATVGGQFNEFQGIIEAAEDDPSNSHGWGTVKVASIDTDLTSSRPGR
jgi:polyisoprenoid-binding protein YceI